MTTGQRPDEAEPSSMSEWSRAVLDAALDAVVMIDRHGRVVYWSPSAAALFGRSWPEVAGRDMAEMIIPPELQEAHRQAFHSSTIDAEGSILGRRIEVVGQRGDGSRFPVELTVTRTDRGTTVCTPGICVISLSGSSCLRSCMAAGIVWSRSLIRPGGGSSGTYMMVRSSSWWVQP